MLNISAHIPNKSTPQSHPVAAQSQVQTSAIGARNGSEKLKAGLEGEERLSRSRLWIPPYRLTRSGTRILT